MPFVALCIFFLANVFVLFFAVAVVVVVVVVVGFGFVSFGLFFVLILLFFLCLPFFKQAIRQLQIDSC